MGEVCLQHGVVMEYKLSVEIPGLPQTVNQLGRKHWALKVKHNRIWEILVRAHAIGNLPDKPLTKAMVTLTRYSSREPDFDGLTSSFKCILDSLVKCGVLKDDNSKAIGQPAYVWERCGPKDGSIRIEVTSVEEQKNIP